MKIETVFDYCLDKVLAFEGGYVNNPKDPGKATNFGVTQETYRQWRRKKLLIPANKDVKHIAFPEVKEIYKSMYWDACRCYDADKEFPVCLSVFDSAVNFGPGKGLRFWRIAVRDVDARHPNMSLEDKRKDIAAEIVAIRIKYRKQIVVAYPNLSVFSVGWGRRDTHLRELCALGLPAGLRTG